MTLLSLLILASSVATGVAQLMGCCENVEPAKGGNKLIGASRRCIQDIAERFRNVYRGDIEDDELNDDHASHC